MDDDSLRQIRCWVLEHGFKYNMKPVIKRFVEESSVSNSVCLNTLKSEDLSDMDPKVMFLVILKKIVNSFEAALKDKTRLFSFYKDLIPITIDLIDTCFEKEQFIAFEVYIDLITRLKLIDLIMQIKEDENSSTIVQNMKYYCPRPNDKYKEDIRRRLHIENEELVQKVLSSETSIRRYILRILINEPSRCRYIADSFLKDINQFMKESLHCLKTVIPAVRTKCGPTIIEKIISGQYDDDASSEFKGTAVEIIHEFVDSKPKAEDLLSLLDMLKANLDPPSIGIPRLSLPDTSIDFGSSDLEGTANQNTQDSAANEEHEDNNLPDDLFIGSTAQFVPVQEAAMELVSDSDSNETASLIGSPSRHYPPIHLHLKKTWAVKLCHSEVLPYMGKQYNIFK